MACIPAQNDIKQLQRYGDSIQEFLSADGMGELIQEEDVARATVRDGLSTVGPAGRKFCPIEVSMRGGNSTSTIQRPSQGVGLATDDRRGD